MMIANKIDKWKNNLKLVKAARIEIGAYGASKKEISAWDSTIELMEDFVRDLNELARLLKDNK